MAEGCRALNMKGHGLCVQRSVEHGGYLATRPIVTVATVREGLELTPAGANNLVKRLEEIGLLREITGYARNRRFRFDPYLRLFEDRGEERG